MLSHKRDHYCGLLNESNANETVHLSGWVQRTRDLGGVVFVWLRDREGLVQVRDPYMVIRVESLVEEFRYLGYVLMYVNEVVEVNLGGGNHSYVVVNTIQTKVHLYVEAATPEQLSGGEAEIVELAAGDGDLHHRALGIGVHQVEM